VTASEIFGCRKSLHRLRLRHLSNGFEVRDSVQLSYGRKVPNCAEGKQLKHLLSMCWPTHNGIAALYPTSAGASVVMPGYSVQIAGSHADGAAQKALSA